MDNILELAKEATMKFCKAARADNRVTGARVAWSFTERRHKLGEVVENCTDATEEDIRRVDAATAQVFADLRQHAGFEGQFDRFVLVTGERGLDVETVSDHVNYFILWYAERASQSIEAKSLLELLPEFMDDLDMTERPETPSDMAPDRVLDIMSSVMDPGT